MPGQPADPEDPILEGNDDLYAAIKELHKLRLLMRDRRQSVVQVLNKPEHCGWVSQLSQEMDGLQFKLAGWHTELWCMNNKMPALGYIEASRGGLIEFFQQHRGR